MKALFVIDVQKEYIDKYPEDLLPRINERIQEAQENNELIIYVKNLRKLKSGTMSYDFAPELRLYSENVIYKDKSSIFSNNELVNILKNNNISEITTIGIDGCCCVASSAIDAAKSGYISNFPCMYIGVQNHERFQKKKLLLKKAGVIIN